MGSDQHKALSHFLTKGVETIKQWQEKKFYVHLAFDYIFKMVKTSDGAVIKFT